MRLATFRISLVVFCIVLGVSHVARADGGPTTRAMLDELNRETTALYKEAQTGIYHVQLPQPKWVSAYAMAAVPRWDKQLDPDLRKRLRQNSPAMVEAAEVIAAPTTNPAENDTTTLPGQGTYLVVRPRVAGAAMADPVLGGKLHGAPTTEPGFTPNNIGLLLDREGHILVPLYVEREAIGNDPIQLSGPDGALGTARFIGSDRQTNLTLLEVDKPAGTPVRMGPSRPDSGSLVMSLSGGDGSGHLALWTDGAQENGVILTTDGRVAGIARYGQFLSGSACQLIVRQLIEFGAVKRATLGVLITEIRQDDPLRRQQPGLGTRSAMRVDQVIANSAADRGGLKAGDLVLAIGGEPISDLPSFAAAIAARTGPTPLQILRGGATIKVLVDLESQK
jgi:hypothetical protein